MVALAFFFFFLLDFNHFCLLPFILAFVHACFSLFFDLFFYFLACKSLFVPFVVLCVCVLTWLV